MLVQLNYLLPPSVSKFNLQHSAFNFERGKQRKNSRKIKSTHTYLPLVDKLKNEVKDVDLIFFKDAPNKEIRYYMVQADVAADMHYGFFGGNVREAMMMGKPVICYLRPE